MTLVRRVSLLLLSFMATLAGCAQPPIEAEDARLRALLPGRDATAGYFAISNNGELTITLTGARSAQARAIEIHESFARGDSVGMRRVETVTVAPGQRIEFAPGGLHLMIFGVEEIVPPFEIELMFRQAEPLTVVFEPFPP